MRTGGFLGTIVLIWLLVGVFAAWQRDYFHGSEPSCATAGTLALTTLAGPLNYFGVNPVVAECHIPQPSSQGAVGLIG